nr:MAG TPA: hypothetical protein [Inoviridae sp.]
MQAVVFFSEQVRKGRCQEENGQMTKNINLEV